MLLPTLAKAKKKANRLKCASQMGQIAKAYVGIAGSGGSFPWLMQDRDNLALYASDYRSNTLTTQHYATYGDTSISNGPDPVSAGFQWVYAYHLGDIRFVLTMPSIRRDLESAKLVGSPSDPKVKRYNQMDSTRGKLDGGKWASSTSRGAHFVSTYAGSYGHHHSGDDQSPESLLVITRNIEGDGRSWTRMPRGWYIGWNDQTARSLSQGSAKAQFLGPSDGPAQNRMSGLDSGTGNFATSDGSVKQADQAQFDSQITATSKVAGGNIIEPNQSINRFYGR